MLPIFGEVRKITISNNLDGDNMIIFFGSLHNMQIIEEGQVHDRLRADMCEEEERENVS